ncbi:MAG: polyribonucleotide nucleotidyltransferase [Chloroflexi bacterium]|nr:polyribonucleotide nucleotidyltransferase [Chloroflexota bacterium]
MLESRSFKYEYGGRTLTVETGKLAGQANASVTVRYGETVVLVTACVAGKLREGVDFLPLTIDYEERLYAAGKIPGSFIRRESRPSQEAILAMRLVDRPLRPLLPKDWRNDIQIVITVLSADRENDPDVLGIIGASAALALSEVPFYGPVSAVHVGYINNELVLNPTMPQLAESTLDLVVASTKEAVVMVEAGSKEVSEDIIMRAIKFGHEANQGIIRLQEEVRQALGKPKKEVPHIEPKHEVTTAVSSVLGERLAQVMSQSDKQEREQGLDSLWQELKGELGETFKEQEMFSVFDEKVSDEIRKSILERGRRVSGRGLTELRPISCEVGLLPRTHGSGLFTRGQTQVLTITTLGSTREEQKLDGLSLEETKRFMHHYNFPPFSTGEVKRLGSPGRREIGHGALAERAIIPVLPADEDFPYTIRLVSEVLSSSGSTSMASVCASSLSLMDAGVPIKKAVAGIAIGLVTDDKGNYAVLTDIEGVEDFNGDMDYKIAGTVDGITAVQLDTKLKGVSMEILEKGLAQALDARMQILDIMKWAINTNRPELSSYAPRMYKLKIDPGKIGAVIGAGGKTIRSITEETKTTIDIESDGTVLIGSPDAESAQKAIKMVEGLTKEIEIGEVYTGKVTRILGFGAMVEILPGKEGMVHVSELADHRVGRVEDVVKAGDEVTVKVIDIDNMGRVNLSIRALLPGAVEETPSADYPFKRAARPPLRRPSEHEHQHFRPRDVHRPPE